MRKGVRTDAREKGSVGGGVVVTVQAVVGV